MSADRSSNQYLHHWEHEDGSVVTLRSRFDQPTLQFLGAMANQCYTFLHSEVNA